MITTLLEHPEFCTRCQKPSRQIEAGVCQECYDHCGATPCAGGTCDERGFCASHHPMRAEADKAHDAINHPRHYTAHPSGVECIRITEHMSFTLGNAVKYIWRADLKGGLEDLQKAAWYINREIERRKS